MGGSSGGGFLSGDIARLEEAAKEKLKDANSDSVPHVFISFAFEDIDNINLLRGQAKNEFSELEFDDYSVKEAFNSANAEYIKSQIRKKIERASVTLIFLTAHSAKSSWVKWEVEESIAQGKGLVAVYKGDIQPTLPAALVKANAKVVKWKHSELIAAIEEARSKRKK